MDTQIKPIRFPSGISKYGYRIIDERYMAYIEFFEDSLQGNNPEYPDNRKQDWIIDPDKTLYEATKFRIYKIEDIITKEQIDELKGFKINVIVDNGLNIFYYRTYEFALNNEIDLKFMPYLYPNGINEHRIIYIYGGRKHKEYFHINGKIEGEFIEYDSRENNDIYISEKKYYVNGNLHGKCVKYNENEQIIEESYYNNDKCIEIYQYIYKNGEIYIKNKIDFIDGKLEGIHKFYKYYYNTDSIEYEECNYINDLKNGICKTYVNDKLVETLYYIDGEANGTYTQSNEYVKWEIGNYKDDYFHGYRVYMNHYNTIYFQKIFRDHERKECKYHYNFSDNMIDKIILNLIQYIIIFANKIRLYYII